MPSDNYEIDHWLKMISRGTLPSQIKDFIEGDIAFATDKEEAIYLRILSKEVIEDQFGDEIRIQFFVRSNSMGQKGMEEEEDNQRVQTPILWYTFNGNLSFEENRESLRDFVLSHYQQAATPPKIQEKRPSDFC
jgi:hypothetical protein